MVGVARRTYGLAVGARPSLLFGAIILLVPVVYAWRGLGPKDSGLVAAIIPILLIGLGLMLYNYRRFDNPFEFGAHYQLSGDSRSSSVRHFSLGYLWFNLRLYFLKSVSWSGHFPFVQKWRCRPSRRVMAPWKNLLAS